MKKSAFLSVLTMSALASGPAFGWTYNSPTKVGTCSNLDESGTTTDFSFTQIISQALFPTPGVRDILKMTFVMPTDTSTHADIIFIERFGAVKYYNALEKKLTLIGTVPNVSTLGEDGLVGVAVERPFKNRVYLAYSRAATASTVNTAINGSFRLSRFTMNPTTRMMDIATEQVLLDVPSARGRWHSASGLQFDNQGNLYWSIGDNETAFTGPGNTRDLRGSIIRIKPNETGAGYTIPPGNFAEVWSNNFKTQGRTALSQQYADTSKVRPEIYIKGTRNAYSFSVDPYRQQVAYGQCGPDYGGVSEVHSNALTANFAGWPFWSGNTTVDASQVSGAQYGKNGASEPTEASWPTHAPTNKNNPINTWKGTMAGAPGPGVDTLPPAAAAKYSYNRSCAMGSLIIRYDGRLRNPGKLPPQMDNVWLMGDYNTRKLRAAKVDASGNVVGTVNVTPGIFAAGVGTADGIAALLDLQQGPDGALYVLNLNCTGGFASGPNNHYQDRCSGILRIEYKGAPCADPALFPAGTTAIGSTRQIERGTVDWLQLGSGTFSVLAEGSHTIRFLDAQGRAVASMQGEGRQQYGFPRELKSNAVYFLEAATERGINVRAFLHH